MSFQAAIHPLGLTVPGIGSNSFYGSLSCQSECKHIIKTKLKAIKGNTYIGNERGNCVFTADINRDNFLSDLQEYAVSLDKDHLEEIYKGVEETRFNHLVGIRNSIGIYIPTFFFFPIHISLKNSPVPIFVGSSVKLAQELEVINTTLQAKKHMDVNELPIKDKFEAEEEDLEDYEADYEGMKNFWPCFTFHILEAMVKKGLEHKYPLFIF